MWSDVFAGMAAVASLFTAAAVGLGVQQLRVAKQEVDLLQEQARTSFEDELAREYRALVAELPAEAFFRDAQPSDIEGHERAFYRYFDLSNEQLFLARIERVSPETREQWEDGVASNFRLPAFQYAWSSLVPHLETDSFEDLRALRRQRRIADLQPSVS